ncbi:MAG: MASE1 domain-containing protein [Gammaproteobacteria bacterium]|nr:MASE1 domain-containing protein [Gammaproteobacteria bacterium]
MYLNLPQRLTAINPMVAIPAYALIHTALVWVGTKTVFNPPFLTPFWPATGVLLGLLLLQPLGRWPIWLTAGFIGHSLFAGLSLRGELDLPRDLAFAALGMISAPLAAGLLLSLLGAAKLAQRPLAALGAVVLAGLVVPVLPGYLTALLATTLGSSTPSFLIWRTYWAGEALGIIAVTPLILAWGQGTGLRWLDSRWRLLEITLAVSALLFTTYQVCAQPVGLSYTILFIVPFFVWLGLRSDTQVVSAAGLASLVIALYQTLMGTGPFIGAPLSDQFSALGLHALYGSLIPAGLVTAHLAEHRQVLQVRFQLAELLLELFTYLVDSSSGELRERIHQALAAVGDFTGSDRAKLLLFRDDKVEVFASWTRPGAADNSDLLQGQPMSRFPWCIGELAANRELRLDRTTSLEAINASERALYKALDVRALQIMPLFDGDRLDGAVALAWARGLPDVGPQRMALLPIATRLFASGLRRTRAQEQLAAYQDSLRLLASELSLAEERVRRATAVDLHDSIGQSLAVARIKLGQLSENDSGETLKHLREILDEAIGHTRNIIADLSPPVLYELGLVQAIRWLADREHRRGDFSFEVTEVGTPGDLSEECKVAAFQCYRELLMNVVKHAHAATVQIHLCWHQDQLEVVVEDDGIGFKSADELGPMPENGRFGLFSVRERIHSLGGQFVVESNRGLGTRTQISVPLSSQRVAV